MILRVSGKNMDIGDALRQHVQDRIAAITAKHFDGKIGGHVTLAPEGSGFRADCTLHLASGMTLQADGVAHEVYAGFDKAAERIEKRLRRYKQRLREHHHPSEAVAGSAMMAAYVIEAPSEEHEEIAEFNPVIIAESTKQLKLLSVSAAVLELDLSGAPVVVFRHAGNGRVNVVYRRRDNNIGWIDPPTSAQK